MQPIRQGNSPWNLGLKHSTTLAPYMHEIPRNIATWAPGGSSSGWCVLQNKTQHNQLSWGWQRHCISQHLVGDNQLGLILNFPPPSKHMYLFE